MFELVYTIYPPAQSSGEVKKNISETKWPNDETWMEVSFGDPLEKYLSFHN